MWSLSSAEGVSPMSFMSRPQISTARTVALTDDALFRSVPSLFAAEPHSSRSEKYTHIASLDVHRTMQKNGFVPVFAKQTRVRDLSRKEFTKHLIRYRHEDIADLKVDDTFPEVVIINSHDGSSSYQIMAGLLRLVCLNGMVVSDGRCETVRVPHKGNVLDLVAEGSFKVLQQSVETLKAAEEWQGITLSRDEQQVFANIAHKYRFADENGEVKTPIEPAQLLQPRRAADRTNDLWRTFNRIQENATKGGLSARNPETGRRTTTKEVKGIDGDIKLNKALFEMAEQMAALKTGAVAQAA